jgi:hypothetical protein
MYPPPRVIARDPKPNHPDADRDFVSSTTHYGSPLVFTRAARRVGVPWPGPVACPWACRGLCTLRRALLSACMSQCGPLRLVYLGSERAVTPQMWPLWCALSTFPQKTRQVSGPSSELLAQAYAGAARPVARLGLATESSVAVHTIACSDVVSFEDESWDIPNV